MTAASPKIPMPNPFYRCAGPNCGLLKRSTDRWWLMWTSFGEYNRPLLVSMPVGRRNSSPRRHAACVRGALRAEAAVAVHGQCSRKRPQAVGGLNNVDRLRLTFLIFRASYLHREVDSGARMS